MSIGTIIENLQCDTAIRAKMLFVTPPAAAAILSLNTHNRKISPAVVAKYVVEHKLADWVKSSSGIGISDDSILLDGQHRLKMIVDSQKGAWLLVVTGLPFKSQEKTDRQRRRSLFDALSLSGEAASRKAVEIATVIVKMSDRLGSRSNGSIPDEAVKAALENHRESIALCLSTVGGAYSQRAIGRAAVLAALTLSLEKNRDKSITFIKQFVSGENLTHNMPSMRLRKWLCDGNRRTSFGAEAQIEDFERTCYALNAAMQGKCIDRLCSATSLE